MPRCVPEFLYYLILHPVSIYYAHWLIYVAHCSSMVVAEFTYIIQCYFTPFGQSIICFEPAIPLEGSITCKQNHKSITNWQYSNIKTKCNKTGTMFHGAYSSMCGNTKLIIHATDIVSKCGEIKNRYALIWNTPGGNYPTCQHTILKGSRIGVIQRILSYPQRYAHSYALPLGFSSFEFKVYTLNQPLTNYLKP